MVEPQRAGMASGINSTFRQVGIATGIAGLGAIFQHLVASDFLARVPASRLPPGVRTDAIADFISFGGAQRVGNGALSRAAEHAFVHGLNHILVYAAILAFAGAVLAHRADPPAGLHRAAACRAPPGQRVGSGWHGACSRSFEHRLDASPAIETRALELEGDGPAIVLLHG